MAERSTAPAYTGAYRDPVAGSYPLGHGYRHYLPALMRFNAPDDGSPFGAGGLNAYTYCAGDPVNHVDPSGHFHLGWQAMVGIGFGIAAIAAAPFTGGASIAGVLAVASGITAVGSGVASGFSSHAAHETASVLGWVSLGTGLLGGAADMFAIGSAAETAGEVEQVMTTSGRFVGEAEPHPVLGGASRFHPYERPQSSQAAIPPAQPAAGNVRLQGAIELYRTGIRRGEIMWLEQARTGQVAARWHTTAVTEQPDQLRQLGFISTIGNRWELPFPSSIASGELKLNMRVIYETRPPTRATRTLLAPGLDTHPYGTRMAAWYDPVTTPDRSVNGWRDWCRAWVSRLGEWDEFLDHPPL